MYMPVYSTDILCNFQSCTEPLQAPTGSGKSSFFFLRLENCSVLSGGKLQEFMLLKAQKYPVTGSSYFYLFSPSISVSVSLFPLALGGSEQRCWKDRPVCPNITSRD